MNYEALSQTRKMFVNAAYKTFPDLNGRISRVQVQQVMLEHKLNAPQWLYTPEFKSEHRGMFKIPQPTNMPEVEIIQETEDEINARITDTYESMESLVKAVAANTVNSLVISGAPGLGKSYTVQKVLEEINEGDYGFVFHKGYIRASHLFRLLWENRHAGSVVVLDDTDAIFSDETALNILKAALEMKPSRRIGWGSEKEFEDQDGEKIPRYFDFQGSVIFLTNLEIHKMIATGGKYAPHLSAMESRSLILELGITTKREYIIKIRQVLNEGMLRNKGITEEQENEIMDFIFENINSFREISLRAVEKVAALYKANPATWRKMVKAVCMNRKSGFGVPHL